MAVVSATKVSVCIWERYFSLLKIVHQFRIRDHKHIDSSLPQLPATRSWHFWQLLELPLIEFSHSYTKLPMLSFLYCFVVKDKLIWAKSLLPPVGIEPATPTPQYIHPNAYPSVLIPQVLIEGSLTSYLFVHQWLLDLEELRGFS